MNALVAVTKEQPEDALVTGPAFYRASTDAAHICRDIVLATATNIQGRRYVQVEGWQAIAIAHGCAASSGNVVRHPDGSVSATGTVVRMDNGVVVSSAEGYVGADEPTWFGGTVTSYGKTKVLPKRPDYAIRAMAQTRAISRACRSAFAHVVVMMNAGLSTTPAEEMGGGDGHEPTPEPTRREPERHDIDAAPAAPKRTFTQWLADIEQRFGAATTKDQLEAICDEPDNARIIGLLKDDRKQRFTDMLDLALDRVSLRAEPSPHVTALREAERELEEMIGERPAMET